MRNKVDDDAFQHDLQNFSGMDNEKFDEYVSVDCHLSTSRVKMMEKLRDSYVEAPLLEAAEEEGGRYGTRSCAELCRSAHESEVFCLCAQQE
jgi:hypothetical protein